MRTAKAGEIQDGGLENEFSRRGYDDSKTSYYAEGFSKIPLRENQQNQLRIVTPASDGPLTSWGLKIEVHHNIGPNRGSVICPTAWNNSRCPICEWRDTAWDTHEADLVKKFYPQPRVIACAIDRLDPNKNQIVQIADMPKVGLYDEILGQCRIPETGQIVNVASHTSGFDIYFMYTKKAGGYGTYSSIQRGAQPNDVSVITKGAAFYLADALIIFEYEQIRELFKPEFFLKGSTTTSPPPVAAQPVAAQPGASATAAVDNLGQQIAEMNAGQQPPAAPPVTQPPAAPPVTQPPAAPPVTQPPAAPPATAPPAKIGGDGGPFGGKPSKISSTPPSLFLTDQDQEGAGSLLELVPSGSVLLNLTLSGTMHGAYPLGRVINLVGDKSSGKSLLCLECMSAARKKWPDAVVRLAEIEAGIDESLYRRMGMPVDTFQQPDPPIETMDDFYKDINKAIKDKDKEQPLIYVIDSLDALMSEADKEADDLSAKGKAYAGVSRPLTTFFRTMKRTLSDNRVLLIIVSQVREVINATKFQKQLYRAGGRALGHYSSQEIWLAQGQKLKVGDIPNGVQMHVDVDKNKVWVAYRRALLNILWNYGVDDTQSCINWLGLGDAKGMVELFGEKKRAKKMVEYIEDNGLLPKLHAMVWEEWCKREAKLKITRKPKWE